MTTFTELFLEKASLPIGTPRQKKQLYTTKFQTNSDSTTTTRLKADADFVK
jgi:hypothetical protein